MESFWQPEGATNCATIAIIKVAILHYGIDNVFKVQQKEQNYHITLKDRKKIIIHEDKIKKLNSKNNIAFSRYVNKEKKKQLARLKAYVKLCYAVMITYLNEYGFEEKKFKVKKAKKILRNGFGGGDTFNTDHLYTFLGLKITTQEPVDIKRKHLPEIIASPGVMLYNYSHVVAASFGYFDLYGKMMSIERRKIPELGDDEAEWWYQLK